MMLVGHHDSLSHPGIHATQRLINQCYVWLKVNLDIRKWAHSCLRCQHSKIHKHTVTPFAILPLLMLNLTSSMLTYVVGPFIPPSQVCCYLLTCEDHFTRSPEAIQISDITTTTIAQAFIHYLLDVYIWSSEYRSWSSI